MASSLLLGSEHGLVVSAHDLGHRFVFVYCFHHSSFAGRDVFCSLDHAFGGRGFQEDNASAVRDDQVTGLDVDITNR